MLQYHEQDQERRSLVNPIRPLFEVLPASIDDLEVLKRKHEECECNHKLLCDSFKKSGLFKFIFFLCISHHSYRVESEIANAA